MREGKRQKGEEMEMVMMTPTVTKGSEQKMETDKDGEKEGENKGEGKMERETGRFSALNGPITLS